jgi:alkanesulfonate monooxygenase SsuD/methylene tetrahydromethanopterin reductase-like flavin-dependent oxidoreductase (luciferase family)
MASSDDMRATNPIFGSRKLKLGSFQSNMDSGCVMSSLEGRLTATWPNTLALARLADEMDFEAVVPVARWRGFGGANNPQGPGFETYTWAAGLASATAKVSVVATSHITINHPIVAAKQSMTIDHISNGRYTLNVVTGWNKPEIDMFGTPMMSHDDRYDCAVEWLGIVRRLWSSEEEFDHEGRFYKIKGGYMEPKPIQKPFPAVMNAGGSDRGRRFAAEHCDIVYTALSSTDIDDCARQVKAYRDMAYREFKRDLKVFTLAYIVQGETEKEARDFHHDYVHVKGDWEAATNVIETLGINAKTFPPDRLQDMKERFIGGWSGYPLVGTKEQIVDGLRMMSEKMGLDGVLLSWPRYMDGMREFRDVTYPLLVQAGLR